MRRYAKGLTGLLLICSVLGLAGRAINPAMPWYMPLAFIGACVALVLGMMLLINAITES